MNDIQSKIFGMVFGHALGDALGAPSEFPPIQPYNGKLEFTMKRIAKPFYNIPEKNLVIGQITDDTEMAMTLSRIIKHGYTKQNAVMEYMSWANSGIPFLGKNTINLFKGIKTYKGYEKRYEKFANPNNQSNGPLMRAYPLVVAKEFIQEDVYITNPNSMCYEIVKIYIDAIQDALDNKSKNTILLNAIRKATYKETKEVLKQVKNNEKRDISGKNKGWIVHSFYCAFYALYNFNSYKEGIDGVMFLDEFFNPEVLKPINKNSRGNTDTDTNCAISGALLGAYYGFFNMCDDSITKKNLQILIRVNPNEGDVPRPEKYHNINLYHISQSLIKMYNSI